MRRVLTTLLLLGISECCAGTFVMDFDSAILITTDGPYNAVTAVEENGFLLFAQTSAAGAGMSLSLDGPCWSSNGTFNLAVPSYAAPVIRQTSGAPFTLQALDLAEYNCLFSGQEQVRFTAGFADNRTYIWDWRLDGISDFGGPNDDFERVLLPPTLSGAAWVRIEGNVKMDNLMLVTVPVPEPQCAELAAVAAIAMGCRRKRRRLRCKGHDHSGEAPG